MREILSRAAPEIWMINSFNLARATIPEILVHVTIPVSMVMQRLRSKGVPLLAYQTESGLRRLQEAYRETGELLRRRRRVEVLELDLTAIDAAEAAERVVTAKSVLDEQAIAMDLEERQGL